MEPLEILIVIAASGMVWFAWRLRHPPARVVVRERGILDRARGLGWISWDDIEGAWQPSRQDHNALHLRLRPEARPARRLRRGLAKRTAENAPGETVDLRLDLEGTGLNPLELLREIVLHGRRGGGARHSG